MPQNMFQGQPNNMPMYQNPQYAFNHFDSKKMVLFYTNASGANDLGGLTNKISTGSIQLPDSYTGDGRIVSGGSVLSASYSSATYNVTDGTFKFTLIEPLQVDKMSDVFLDNLTFANASFNASATPDQYGVVLQINELQQNVVSNNININNRELIVINSSTLQTSGRPTYYESKNKKFNYLGVIPPGNYKEINGVLCNINGGGIISLNQDSANLCFSIELVISNQH